MLLPAYIDTESENFLHKFSAFLSDMLENSLDGYTDVVFVCIGTDRATGDSFGPMIGTILKRSNTANVFGTLDNPVHALNLGAVTDMIKSSYKKPFIIAIDASLGTNGHIGCVTISRDALCPGSAMSKDLGSIGNIAITGIVNKWSVNSLSVLQSTRLSVVVHMAELLAGSIDIALKKINSLTNREFSRII